MEAEELLRRMRDLARKCEKYSEAETSFFLTPTEQNAVRAWASRETDCRLFLSGGQPECERKIAVFLPYYETGDPAIGEYIRAVKLSAFFGEPGHRDYLGAILGLGVRREWIGDIRISGAEAYVFCLPSVEGLLLSSLERVGRITVKAEPLPVDEVPAPRLERSDVTLSVQSPRLDAVVSGLFRLSRTQAAHEIALGSCSLNYEPCLKPDTHVSPGDIISLRGHGKAAIADNAGLSRKGRQLIKAELYK